MMSISPLAGQLSPVTHYEDVSFHRLFRARLEATHVCRPCSVAFGHVLDVRDLNVARILLLAEDADRVALLVGIELAGVVATNDE